MIWLEYVSYIDRVWLKTEDSEILVPLHQVQVGDRVAVRMGGMIPLDGVLLEGEVMINQASLTGESIPVSKRPGSSVMPVPSWRRANASLA